MAWRAIDSGLFDRINFANSLLICANMRCLYLWWRWSAGSPEHEREPLTGAMDVRFRIKRGRGIVTGTLRLLFNNTKDFAFVS